MIHRTLRYQEDWEWHQCLPAASDDDSIQTLKREMPECASWLDDINGRSTNHITVNELIGGTPLLSGTLLFQASEDQKDIQPLHFWMTERKLITLQSDLRLSVKLQRPPWEEMLQRCLNAPEAFSVILSALLETLHSGLDAFENRLNELEQTMRKNNHKHLIDHIFERRYDLLHWNHLYIPFREIEGAAKEAFMQRIEQAQSFQKLLHKLDRIEALLQHYGQEIDTLISMDDAISSFRGNDIMKTLTIFTAVFTPATLAGALWGTNFKHLPWTGDPLGFIVMSVIVLLGMFIIYVWLWRKGWTGDLLRGSRQAGKASDKTRLRRNRPGVVNFQEQPQMRTNGQLDAPPRARRSHANKERSRPAPPSE